MVARGIMGGVTTGGRPPCTARPPSVGAGMFLANAPALGCGIWALPLTAALGRAMPPKPGLTPAGLSAPRFITEPCGTVLLAFGTLAAGAFAKGFA